MFDLKGKSRTYKKNSSTMISWWTPDYVLANQYDSVLKNKINAGKVL